MVPSHDNSSPKQHDLQPGKKEKTSQLAVMLATHSHAIESVRAQSDAAAICLVACNLDQVW